MTLLSFLIVEILSPIISWINLDSFPLLYLFMYYFEDALIFVSNRNLLSRAEINSVQAIVALLGIDELCLKGSLELASFLTTKIAI